MKRDGCEVSTLPSKSLCLNSNVYIAISVRYYKMLGGPFRSDDPTSREFLTASDESRACLRGDMEPTYV